MGEAAEPSEQHCPRCQAPLRSGARFCSVCGASADPAAGESDRRKTPRDSARFSQNLSGLKRIGYLFGLLLLSSLVLGIVGKHDPTPWSDVVMSVIDAVMVFIFAGARYREILPLMGWPRADWRTALRLLGLALAFIAVMAGYFALLERAGVPIVPMTTSYEEAGWGVGPMLLLISITPAVVEELAFRGIIQTGLTQILGSREALLIQAALFSVLHLSPMMFPSHFVMGLCFGYLRQRTNSLYPGMLLHASWNALVVCQELYFT